MIRLVVIMLLVASFGHARTWDIVEPDLMTEIEAKRDMVLGRLTAQAEGRAAAMAKLVGEPLEPAEENETRFIDPTFTLSRDIPRVDESGNVVGVLYPKGYTFNPVDFTPVDPPTMAVFNACDDNETAFVKGLLKDEPGLIPVSSGCPLGEIEGWDRRVALLSIEMKERLELSHTVSVISLDRKRRMIRVDVYPVP